MPGPDILTCQKDGMSKENVEVTLTRGALFQGRKRLYSGSLPAEVNGVQLLATNEIDGYPQVRLQVDPQYSPNDFRFTVDGDPDQYVIAAETVAPGILEFLIVSDSQRQVLAEEAEAWAEHRAETTQQAANRQRIRPAQEGLVWKRYQAKQEAEDAAEAAAIANALSPEEEAAVQEILSEDEPEVRLGCLRRETYPRQAKSDRLVIELFSPFAETQNAQLQISRQFRFTRRGETEPRLHESRDVSTFAVGAVVDQTTPIVIDQNLFFPAAEFELILTIKDLRSGRERKVALNQDDFGAAVEVTAVKPTPVSPRPAERPTSSPVPTTQA